VVEVVVVVLAIEPEAQKNCANCASHGLAALGRIQERTVVLLRNSPPKIVEAIKADFIPTV
jgi:hypothetical protein